MSTIVGDILRVTPLLVNGTSGQVANVYLVKSELVTSTPLSDAQTLLDMAQYMDDMYDNISPMITNETVYDSVNMFNVTQDRPLGNQAWPTQTAGASGGQTLPHQVAAFLQGNTGFSRCWARKFIGVFSEDHNSTTGRIEATLLAALADLAADWLAGYTSVANDQYEPVVFSTKAAIYKYLSEIIIRDVWATIRRRRIGRGA